MIHVPEPRLPKPLLPPSSKLGSQSRPILAEHAASKTIVFSCMTLQFAGGKKETNDSKNLWPELPLAEWKDTYDTLHMWTQIVGKIRLAVTPFVNHWWNATLYVTPRGLTTSAMFYKGLLFQINFDFIAHILLIEANDGSTKTITLRPRSVADFYQETMATLGSLGMPVTIWTTPVEVPDRTPFENDQKHAAYDPEYARQFWRILVQVSRVLTEFRSRFIGKASPVHFFWGAF